MKERWKPVLNLPAKANKILNTILVALILIAIRVWHLAVIQHEEKVEASRKPQTRTVVERAPRATIRDRFGKLLAANRVQYNVAVSYGEIRAIPRSTWKKDGSGKRVKVFARKEYITALSKLLGEELNMDSERIEDTIHARASIFGSAPYVIKENISEREYFRLTMLEKDWPGVCAELVSKRAYPLSFCGGDVVGYMGAISKREYEAITEEMQLLRRQLEMEEEEEKLEAIAARLSELEGRAYTINDDVGKAGVESTFDERLRGFCGKRIYLSDTRGNFVRELGGGKGSTPGKRLDLTISAELQEFAEQLLVEYEQKPRSENPPSVKWHGLVPEEAPWIRGGAIVALEPNTGEILALASFPRFDPNSFIRSGDIEQDQQKAMQVNRWLENECHIAALWNRECGLKRERFDMETGTFYEESKELKWRSYLDLILPKHSPVKSTLERYNHIKDSIFVQRQVERLCSLFPSIPPAKVFDFLYQGGEDVPQDMTLSLQEREFLQRKVEEHGKAIRSIKEELAPFFQHLPLNYEKLLLNDLYRVVIDPDRFSPLLIELLGEQTIGEFRDVCGRMVPVEREVQMIVEEIYHENHFKRWREEHFKGYLAQKRKEEEVAKKRYGRPYLEYLNEAERLSFAQFWKAHRLEFLALFLTGERFLNDDEFKLYTEALQQWVEELSKGAHTALPWAEHYRHLKEVVDTYDTTIVIPYLKTLRQFADLNRPLLGIYSGLRREKGKQYEKHLAAAFYPTYGYGYARSQAFRQSAAIGSIFKLVPAYEALRQRFHVTKEKGLPLYDLNPLTIIDDKHHTGDKMGWSVGYTLDRHSIPLFYRGGRLPRSEHGGVGMVDIVGALEASSNPYFSLLAGDVLEDPEDLCRAASLFGFGEKSAIALSGEIAGKVPVDVAYNRTGLYAMAIGQHSLVGTPLQIAMMFGAIANGGHLLRPKIALDEMRQERRQIFLPEEIRRILLTGMKQVIHGERGTARYVRSQFPCSFLTRVVGKTSTAEAVEHLSLDGASGHLRSKHIWFGAIAFEDENYKKPKLVVIVYLRLGDYGRLAAPYALKMIQKWEEIRNREKS